MSLRKKDSHKPLTLKEMLDHRLYSQAEFASMIDVSESDVSGYCHRKHAPRRKLIRKMAEVLKARVVLINNFPHFLPEEWNSTEKVGAA